MGHHWLLLQASYDKVSERMKLLALSGVPLMHSAERCSVTWIRFISLAYMYPRIGRWHLLLLLRRPPCTYVHVYIPLGILHTPYSRETAWWLTSSSMNGRASSYLYKHLQQTNVMHHKRPCGQPCVPKPRCARHAMLCHAATTTKVHGVAS